MMSKYSVAFYTLSILAGILFTRQRKIFLNKHFYFACLIGLLIFLPNIWWQYDHRFPVINHMNELQEEQLKYNSAIGFIISQIMMNLPCVFIWIAGLIFVIFKEQGKQFRFIAWTYLFVITLLIVLRGKDYYALGLILSYLPLALINWKKLPAPIKMDKVCNGHSATCIRSICMPLIMPLAKPEVLANYYEKTGLSKTGSFKWEDQQMHPLPQDFADMMGWKEMALKAGVVYNSLPQDQKMKTWFIAVDIFRLVH
jgi:uncharacterized membrane protein